MQLISPPQVKRSVIISTTVVTLSVVTHGAVLWLPLPSPAPQEESLSVPQPRDEEIAVVVIPEQASAVAPLPQDIESSPAPSADSAPVEAGVLLPTDVAPEAALPPPPLPSEPMTAPSAKELPEAEGTPQSVVTPPTNEGPLLEYGDGFPHVAGAVGDCFGLSECRQVPDASNFQDVRQNLPDALITQGYEAERRHDLTDSGLNVFAIKAPGSSEEQFLTIFSSVEDDSVIYILTSEPLTLEQLKQLANS
ncbi:MAG: hypothetical protein AAF827_03720 [Cyanobacteria bacterium P01_D01_bin.6]